MAVNLTGFLVPLEYHWQTPAHRHDPDQGPAGPAPGGGPDGPGPGHPERLIPHVPPTPEEHMLWSQLR
ncbi:DUF6059 family protein [Streptomyces sp. NPDC001985]|uniref:DUF6059 family protein n=1 Tax=Streptomyces sp. NPDC001985 TaxID=3154406 RepID=UPI00332667C6